MNWAGKRVALLGLGRSNLAMARHLAARGAQLVAFDAKSAHELGEAYHQLAALPQIEFQLGSNYLDKLVAFEVIFVAPGVKKHLPQLLKAQAEGSLITTEIAYFLQRCQAPVLGITGSSGKTTTTTLVGGIMGKGTDRPVYVGGNIGNVLVEQVEDIPAEGYVVLELSSFQLQTVTSSPHWAALLNVRPNHLDIHTGYEEYQAAKSNIFRFQTDEDWLVFNEDDALVQRLSAGAKSQKCAFSRREKRGYGARLLDGDLVYVDETGVRPILAAKDLRIIGQHNVENALAAVALTTLAGVASSDIAEVLASFSGVEHRLERVRVHQGIIYINDSIATTPDRTAAALQAVAGTVVLIAGGYDKKLSFAELPGYMPGKVRVLITLGATAPLIEEAVARLPAGEQPLILRCSDLPEAVQRASEVAHNGDTVLLSPACASFDMFSSYEERGYCFKMLVRQLC